MLSIGSNIVKLMQHIIWEIKFNKRGASASASGVLAERENLDAELNGVYRTQRRRHHMHPASTSVPFSSEM